MMKKLFATLLVAVMLLSSVAALAENVYEGDLFTVSYPDGWVVMDEDTIDSVVEMITNGEIPGLDSSAVSQYVAQVKDAGMVILMSDDGLMNVNFIAQNVGQPLTSDLILTMAPQLLSGYESAFPGYEVIDAGSIVTFGENEYVQVAISAELMGIKMTITQLLSSNDTDLNIITFTTTQGEDFEQGVADAALSEIATSFAWN